MSDILSRAEEWLDTKLSRWKIWRLQSAALEIQHEMSTISYYTASDLRRSSIQLKAEADKGEGGRIVFTRAFALAAVAARRLFGYFPNATQIAAAIVLSEGNIIEMRPGEGKTVVALLASYWQVIQGRHVDIATTNDYLAERDQRWMGFAFGVLGVSVGVVISTTPRSRRAEEYRKHITYVSNQELGFDYLNDNLAVLASDLVSGPRDFVIVDEVDSILLDEARTALIITEPDAENRLAAPARSAEMKQMLSVAQKLKINRDYTADYQNKTLALTDEGVELVRNILGRDIYAEKDIGLLRAFWYALYALVFIHTDEDFMINNGKVVLVDEFTGHALPDRVLFEGLQEAVEAIAGVKPSGEFRVTATITYRSFFRLYGRIAGMTGTAFSARQEFTDLYGLKTVPFRPHQSSLRYDWPTRFFASKKDKLAAAVQEAKKAISDKAALLIVGRTVSAAKECGAVLESGGIAHQLLHASVGSGEADIIRRAGNPGMITVATNMAGRGADIVIGESMRGKTGLRVLGLEHNNSRRIDDQLRGRSGRQGGFGETQIFISLDDELPQAYADDEFWNYADGLNWTPEGVIDAALADGVIKAQKKAERMDAETRLSLARFENVVDHHRRAAYKLRAEILMAEEGGLCDVLLPASRHILFAEEFHMEAKDFTALCRWQELDDETRQSLGDFINQRWDSLCAWTRRRWQKQLGEKKKTALLEFDQSWQRYLESVQWLEGWISLTALGNEDPYISFAKTTDRMFHDMRREFALKSVKSIFAVSTVEGVF